MSKRTIRIAGPLILLLLILSVSCGADPVGDPVTPTAAPSSAALSGAAPTLTPALTLTGPAAEAASPLATPSPEATSRPTEPPPTEEANFVTHTVQPGDTLLGLAKQYGVPMAAIQLQNDMGASTEVFAGQQLTIPPAVGWKGTSPFWVLHVVSEGETLIEIARAYDLEAATLQSVNGLVNADAIGVGQNLVLPLDAPALAYAPSPTAPPTAVPTPAPSAVPPTASPAPTPVATAAPADPPPAAVADWGRELARLINQVRAQHGLPPLAYNETLARAAQAHANDCAQRGWGSHTGSDGSDIKTRILRAGYEDPGGWAECWAQRKSPQGAVDIWMDEEPPNDPHRRTLLTTWLSEIGIGVAKADWGYYFIADFGKP